MISTQDRCHATELIDEAEQHGARRFMACRELNICTRTYQRWFDEDGRIKNDRRPETIHQKSKKALSDEERKKVIAIANRPEFASLPPSQIVPALADRGEYVASESTFYRILKAEGMQHHRGRAARPKPKEPNCHQAKKPNEVWVWDITWLPGPVKGTFYYLYLMLDLFSRKVVGWEVMEEESADCAAQVLTKASIAEGRGLNPLVLHSDNGSPMKGATMLATLQRLGIASSFSRPGVSDDNAQVEAFFRTLKYRPGYPSQGFQTLENARTWSMSFIRWYNFEHRHSAIQFVTPAQRHSGDDALILAARQSLYQKARANKPERWSGKTRNWDKSFIVNLNGGKKTEK